MMLKKNSVQKPTFPELLSTMVRMVLIQKEIYNQIGLNSSREPSKRIQFEDLEDYSKYKKEYDGQYAAIWALNQPLYKQYDACKQGTQALVVELVKFIPRWVWFRSGEFAVALREKDAIVLPWSENLPEVKSI